MKRPIGSKIEQMFDKVTSAQKIATIFYKYPYNEFTLSEIALEAGISKSMASIVIQEMANNGFVVLEQLGKKLWRIRANSQNFTFKKWKISNNLQVIYNSGAVEFLIENFNPKAIILFGSFRWGEDGKGSDIDIAVEVLEEKNIETYKLSVLAEHLKKHDFHEYLKNWEKEMERNMQVHFFNRNHIDLNLFNNIANGILLYGFLEVRK